MKPTKILLIFLMTLTVLSCKKDDNGGGSSFLLTNANLAGIYNMALLFATIDQTIDVNGIPVDSNITAEGSTFQLDIIFNEDGTYTAEGQYLLTTTTTAAGQTETDTEIIVLDEGGTYSLNANTQTIFLSGSGGELGSGTFDITLFNETQLQIMQEETILINGVSADLVTEYHFVRQ